jgi:hypothetical protein
MYSENMKNKAKQDMDNAGKKISKLTEKITKSKTHLIIVYRKKKESIHI